MQKRLYVVASDALRHVEREENTLHSNELPPCGSRHSLSSLSRKSSQIGISPITCFLVRFIRRVMHSRILFLVVWKDSERKKERHCFMHVNRLVIGVLSMGLLKLETGDYCLCMRHLCKSLWIAPPIDRLKSSCYFHLEVWWETQGAKDALDVCWRFHCKCINILVQIVTWLILPVAYACLKD